VTIAVCTPELNGDVLWAVPAARELARRHGCKVDFWLGPRGRALKDLLEVQDFVERVFVDETYENPLPDGSHEMQAPKRYQPPYEHVHQLGFKHGMEIKGTLLDYFCAVVGLPRQEHRLDLPGEPFQGEFVALAFKGTDQSMVARWKETFCDFVRWSPLSVLEVGIPNTAITLEAGAGDCTSHGFLLMAKIIAACKVFVGTISSPLVIADAFPNVHRVAVHDGGTWNLDYCTKSPMNHYPVNPTGKQLAELVRSLL
jgi:hypothetical protein